MNSIGLHFTSLVRRIVARMSSTNSSYEDAIRKLNSLQSNKSTIEQIKKGLKTGQRCTNIEDMENYLKRVGIPLSRLDQLSVIHVAGTKGKGSTSAMCESILREHGYRTGFYSSPHLVEARERIRLDSRPLSREDFAETLHYVYGLLWDTQEYEGDMPKYFAFLTVCAFHEFLRRRVDVAVIEVGIGGIVDYTNVLQKVPVVGITALGLDHTSILGSTLPEIAAAKAGVMKRGCDAYTVVQEPAAMDVLRRYADTVKCPLTIVPDYSTYKFESKPQLPVDLDAYRTNASLAMQLAHAWMRQAKLALKRSYVSDYKEQNGVNSVVNKSENGLTKLALTCSCLSDKEPNAVNCVGYKDQNGLENMRQGNLELKCSCVSDHKEQSGVNGVVSQSWNGVDINSGNKLKSEHNGLERDNITTEKEGGKVNFFNGYSEVNKMNAIKALNKEKKSETDTVVNDNITENFVTNSNKLTNKAVNGINANKIENNMKSDNTRKNGIENVIGNTKIMTNGNILTDKLTNGMTNGNTFEMGMRNDGNVQKSHIANGNTVAKGMTNGNILGKLLLQVPLPTVQGLSQCRWPGRYQVIEAEFAKFYLDGAHTKESMEICARWFLDNSSSNNQSLIFSATGDRNAATLLQPLTNIPFEHIYFVSPTAHKLTYKTHDNYSLVEQQELEKRCQKHAQIWREKNLNTKVYIFECVADALDSIKVKNKKVYDIKRSELEDTNGKRSEEDDINVNGSKKKERQSVLITGSLHLVGAALSILDPNLSSGLIK